MQMNPICELLRKRWKIRIFKKKKKLKLKFSTEAIINLTIREKNAHNYENFLKGQDRDEVCCFMEEFN